MRFIVVHKVRCRVKTHMYCVGREGESASEVHERFLASINATDTLEDKPVFEYEDFVSAPVDFCNGQGALVAIATNETPGVQVESDAPIAVQVVETGNADDLAELLPTLPIPTMLLPPLMWIPLFPTHEQINPSNPEYIPTVEAVLRAFVDHQNTVNDSVASALEHAEKRLEALKDLRTPDYRAPDILKRKGMAAAFSCSHAIMLCIADHRPLPPRDKRPLIMLLGGAANQEDAEKLIGRYVREGKTPHVVRGVPARKWFSPQLLYLRRMNQNDVAVMERGDTQEFMNMQRDMMMRDADGRTFNEKAKDINDFFREASSAADGGQAAEPAQTPGADGGAGGAAEGEGGSA